MLDMQEMQSRLEAMSARLSEMEDREQIRECIYRINRGIDRIDETLLRSGFFEDAMIRWAAADYVSFPQWIDQCLTMQQKTKRVQHLIGNILIERHGDTAYVESAEIGRHLTPMGAEMKDLVIAARYLDTFEKRDGEWRITKRDKTGDWIRIIEGTDLLWDNVPLKGQRNSGDISYERFGNTVFHP